MRIFTKNFKWIMLLSGLLTCTMFLGLISPQAALKSNFGFTNDGPLTEIIVRNWAALIGIIGIILIYGAFVPTVRRFCLIVAGTTKLIFISLVLLYGRQYMEFGVGTAVIVDSVMIVLFAIYLLVSKNEFAEKPINS